MFKYVHSACVSGGKGVLIRIESDIRDGLPSFTMVGYVSANVKEASERALSALYNSGFTLKPKRILINLSPADVKKDGTSFDLPIAMAILASFMDVPQESLMETAFAGELSLDGSLREEGSILPIVLAAKNAGITRFVMPFCALAECAEIEGIETVGVKTLEDAALYMISGFIDPPKYEEERSAVLSANEESLDFADVRGQSSAIRAAFIAACGMHNMALIGPAGSGKSMIAKRIGSILPPLSYEEAVKVSETYSLAGLMPAGSGLIRTRPFRSPNHTASLTTLCGGKSGPGEMALASSGVLFLDEFPEFKSECIEALREPLEDKEIKVAGKDGLVTYPFLGITVIAANPCACGFYPDRRRCRCTEAQIKKYLGKISRPIWDRLDLVAVTEDEGALSEITGKPVSSAELREKVRSAWDIQRERFKKAGILFNSEMDVRQTKKYCKLGPDEQDFLAMSVSEGFLSGRGQIRVLQVARTIADAEGSENITLSHLAESIHARSALAGYVS